MNLQPMNQQPISDDQELAKVLAGVGSQNDDMQLPEIETTQVPTPVMPAPAGGPIDEPVADTPVLAEMPSMSAPVPSVGSNDLDSIKQDALNELRPLVDKLDVSPEEKFDTYLLLLRSTDDQSLIAPAHDAAKSIPDEARRAQALLDIIKEIDFLSNPQH